MLCPTDSALLSEPESSGGIWKHRSPAHGHELARRPSMPLRFTYHRSDGTTLSERCLGGVLGD